MNDAYITALSNALKDQNVPAFADGAMQILAQKIEAAKAEIAPDTYASMGFEFAPVVEEEFDEEFEEEIVEEKCEDCDDKECEDKDEEDSDKEEETSDEKDDEEEKSEEEEDDEE